MHTSGCVMVDVPCLDYLWDGQKDCQEDIISTCGKYQETCPFACFWDSYGSLAMIGSLTFAFILWICFHHTEQRSHLSMDFQRLLLHWWLCMKLILILQYLITGTLKAHQNVLLQPRMFHSNLLWCRTLTDKLSFHQLLQVICIYQHLVPYVILHGICVDTSLTPTDNLPCTFSWSCFLQHENKNTKKTIKCCKDWWVPVCVCWICGWFLS